MYTCHMNKYLLIYCSLLYLPGHVIYQKTTHTALSWKGTALSIFIGVIYSCVENNVLEGIPSIRCLQTNVER